MSKKRDALVAYLKAFGVLYVDPAVFAHGPSGLNKHLNWLVKEQLVSVSSTTAFDRVYRWLNKEEK